MARIQEMMIGISGETAKAIAGSCNDNVTAAGTTTADATVLTAANSLVLAGADNTGVKLPPNCQIGDTFYVGVGTGNSVIVYPPTGEEINNAAKADMSNLTGGVFIKVGPLHWISTALASA
jgi:hypothetical protein